MLKNITVGSTVTVDVGFGPAVVTVTRIQGAWFCACCEGEHCEFHCSSVVAVAS